jgi:L-threonylcarbamoyladenylate synthase
LTATIICVDAANPPFEPIARAAAAIRAGRLVVYPTRCLYGLGVDAFNPAAARSLFEAKQRPLDKPVSVLVRNLSDLDRVAAAVPGAARVLMERFWPGSLTLVFDVRPQVPQALTAGTGKIGVRLPAHPVAVALVAAFGGPITATSANLSGAQSPAARADVDASLIEAAAIVLDAGPLLGGAGSTIVDVSTTPVRIVREGIVPAVDVMVALAG